MTTMRINLQGTGRNIERLRKRSDISVRQLQKIFDFHTPQAIYKWQRGSCLPSVDNLVVLAREFNTSIEEILDVVEDPGSQAA